MDNEIVFQPVDRARVNEVNPGPEIAVDDPSTGLQPGAPFFRPPLKIGDQGPGLFERFWPHRWVGIDKIDLECPAMPRDLGFGLRWPDLSQAVHLLPGYGWLFSEDKGYPLVGEEDRDVPSLHRIGHPAVELAMVWNEEKR